MFHVGQKVVCIRALFALGRGALGEMFPAKGEIYTIRSLSTDWRGTLCLRVSEIVNEPRQYIEGFGECAFDVNHFRPIIERKNESGMSILTDILVKTKVKEPA